MLPDSAQSCVKGGSNRTSSDIVVEWQLPSVGCVWVGGCVGVGVLGWSLCIWRSRGKLWLLVSCSCLFALAMLLLHITLWQCARSVLPLFWKVGVSLWWVMVTRGVGLFYAMLSSTAMNECWAQLQSGLLHTIFASLQF